MMFNLKNPAIFGEIKEDSRYERIEEVPFFLAILCKNSCAVCGNHAEYLGKLKNSDDIEYLCFEDMLKELNIKPKSEGFIEYLRNNKAKDSTFAPQKML